MSEAKKNLWFGAFLLLLIVLSLIFLFLLAKNPTQIKPTVVSQEKQLVQEKLLAPEVKHAVNQALAPEGVIYPKTENAKGITIDVSQRAASVATAVIDEKGKVHIQDYTAPIKE